MLGPSQTTSYSTQTADLYTGCTFDTNIQHMRDKTNILPLCTLETSRFTNQTNIKISHPSTLTIHTTPRLHSTTTNTPQTSKHTKMSHLQHHFQLTH